MSNYLKITMLLFSVIGFTSNVTSEEALFFDSSGTSIHYTDSKGGGASVILLHGFTMNLDMWYDTGIAHELSKEHGDIHLASVARGWAYDAVSLEQISNVSVPMQAVFGSEEQGEFYSAQRVLLERPSSSRPIIVIEGADHDSENAAVLSPEFLSAAKSLIKSVKMD